MRFQSKLQAWLRASGQSRWRKELLLPFLGLLVLLRILPPLTPPRPLTFWQLVLAAAFLLLGLQVVAVVLSAAQPALYAMGSLPWQVLTGLAGLGVWGYLRRLGAQYLMAWEQR